MNAAAVDTRQATPAVPLHASLRWRVVGWMVLGTALTMLAMIMTMRSVLLGRVALDTNAAIVQEIGEFRTFAREGRDPRTARPFATLEALMDRYLLRQTPDSGEAFIAVVPEGVLYLNNASQKAGEVLAQDPERLSALVDAPELSGIERTTHGEMRWGKTRVQAANGQTGVFIVTHFTAHQRQLVLRETAVYFGVAFAGLLLIGALAWIVAGQVLTPIRQINAAARRVGARGPAPRVPVSGSDELAELARGFNTMAARVDQAHTAQQHFIEQVQRHFNQAGRRAQAHLARLDAAGGNAAAQAAERQALHTLLGRVDQTLADLGLLIRATQPDFLQPAPVDLAALADDVLAQAGALRDAQGQPRRWQLQAQAQGTAPLDAPRVLDAMRHLLGNAVAHSQPGDTLEVSAEQQEENGVPVLRLSVASPGQPLTAEQAQAVFAFSHLLDDAPADDDKDSGMGVGLAVVRAVAEAHGGYAWVQAGAEWGNRFGLTLPLGPAKG
ncbi:MAG: HAMP domain-containing sensor histidine kinase [Pseudomonadota bacterium]|nr:HAMP domain-containing sensor histidine kinase [Pseudomonadota bacterium]